MNEGKRKEFQSPINGRRRKSLCETTPRSVKKTVFIECDDEKGVEVTEFNPLDHFLPKKAENKAFNGFHSM